MLTDLLPTAEVASLLGVHVSTVPRLVRSGRLTPVTKLPGKRGAYLFDPAEISAYIARSAA